MIYRITLQDIKPFSINKAHYRRGQRTKECRSWSFLVHEQIAKDPAFIQFKKRAKKASFFHVHLRFNIPEKKFYTKTGKISRLTSDLTNVEKMLVDVIFDPRFHGRVENDLKIVTLECDDTLITKLVSEKGATNSDSYSIDVSIQVF
jgi:hypothetical protein